MRGKKEIEEKGKVTEAWKIKGKKSNKEESNRILYCTVKKMRGKKVLEEMRKVRSLKKIKRWEEEKETGKKESNRSLYCTVKKMR